MLDNFFYKKLTASNLDNYYIRTSIKKVIDNNLPLFKGKLLDAGCGKMPYRKYILENSIINEYVGLDIDSAINYSETVKPDITWNGKVMPFKDNSFDTIFATEVLEHCLDFNTFIKESLRVLKPEGILFFTVPFLWPLHETPNDHYRYTPFTLKSIFDETKTETQIFALGGWNASLATMIGLWTKRHLSKKKSKYIIPLVKPIISYLIKKDKIPMEFKDNTMATGFYGIVKKK